MAISFVNKSAFASGTAALNVGAVSGVVADDLLLLFVESENQAVSTPAGGWTQVTGSPVSTGTAAAAGAVRLTVFYLWATGADGTTTVADTGDHTTAIKIAYRGVDRTTPFDATPVSGIKTPATTTATFPAITTATNNALVVLASALDLDAASTATTGTATNANLTSINERHDQTVIAGDGGGLVIIDGVKASPGNTGTTTATVTSTIQVYLTIALREEPITGTLSVTETGTETFAATGDVLVEGAFAATETGSDTFASDGSVIVEGSLAVSETGDDVFAATGSVLSGAITGSLDATETGNDTFASTGDVVVTGAFASTETGTDTFSSTGDVVVQGALSATEVGDDTFSSEGVVKVQGSLSATETGTDTFAATGEVADAISAGTLAATETGTDTLAATGKVVVNGSLSASDSPDTFASAGAVKVQGSLDATENGADTFAASGSVFYPAISGDLAAQETGNDTFAASGTVQDPALFGSLDATETGADTFSATAKALVKGSLTALEVGQDIFVGSGDNVSGGVMSAAETGADQFGIYVESGYVAPGYVEQGVSGTVLVEGSLAASETGSDRASFIGAQPVVVEPSGSKKNYFRPVREVTVRVEKTAKVAGSTRAVKVFTSAQATAFAWVPGVKAGSRKARVYRPISVVSEHGGASGGTWPVQVTADNRFMALSVARGLYGYTAPVTVKVTTAQIVSAGVHRAKYGTIQPIVKAVTNPGDDELLAITTALKQARLKQKQSILVRFK